MKTYKKSLLVIMAILAAVVFTIIIKNKNKKNISHLNLSSYPVKTMDPILCDDNNSAIHICTIYETLFQYNPFKKKLEPCLASKMPSINKNVLTIKIKKGIKFHDNKCFSNGKGRELKAKDVRFSIMRNADPKLESKGFYIIDNKIVGLNDWRENQQDKKTTDYSQNILGLKIIDDYTLQITLLKPLDRFIQILSTPFFAIVPKEAYDYYGLDLTNNPVGTGPFKLVHYNPSANKMSYVRNEGYRKNKLINSFKRRTLNKKTALLKNRYKRYFKKKLPLVDKITFYIVQTYSDMLSKFKNGEIDILDAVSNNDTEIFDEYGKLSKQYKDKGIRLEKFNSLETCYIVFNLENKLFEDPISKNKKIVNQLRRAMSLGFDRIAFNNKFYKKSAKVAQSAIPPRIMEYEENYKNPFNVYDLERANQILDNLGYTEYVNPKDKKYRKGLDGITIDILNGEQNKNEILFFKECMKRIGVNIIIKTNTHASLNEKIIKGNFMLTYKCFNPNYADAEYILQIGYSNLISPKGSNLSRYHNKHYDELFNKILNMNKSLARTRLCRKLNRILGNKAVAIFINHKDRINAYHPWITSVWSYNNFDYIKYIGVDSSRRTLDPKKNKK